MPRFIVTSEGIDDTVAFSLHASVSGGIDLIATPVRRPEGAAYVLSITASGKLLRYGGVGADMGLVLDKGGMIALNDKRED